MPYEIEVTVESPEDAKRLRDRVGEEARRTRQRLQSRQPEDAPPPALPRFAAYAEVNSTEVLRGVVHGRAGRTVAVEKAGETVLLVEGFGWQMPRDPAKAQAIAGMFWDVRTSPAEKERWRRRLKKLGFEATF